MNKLYIYLSLFIFVACSPSNIPQGGLEEKEGLKYEIDSQVPYNGPYEFYHDNGQLQQLGNFIEGKENGPFEFYHDNGQLQKLGNLIEGKTNGIWELYYDNGQLQERGNYKDNNRNGPFEFYYDNGQLQERGNFIEGKTNGIWEFYYDNGQLQQLGNYKNGIKNGPFEWYYDNGQLQQLGNYKDNNMHGIFDYFTSTGGFLKNTDKKLWVDGNEFSFGKKLQSNEVVERDGVVYKVNSTTPFIGIVNYYHTNYAAQLFNLGQQLGTSIAGGNYDNDKDVEEQTLRVESFLFNGKREGLHKYFKSNGELSEIGIYRGGKEQGRWTRYLYGGKLTSTTNYNNGLKDGLYKFYHTNGQLREKGLYKDDKRDGIWKVYDFNGGLSTCYKYDVNTKDPLNYPIHKCKTKSLKD